MEKLRKAAEVDRHITLKEILEKIFGLIPEFKSKDELLEEEFAKFVADVKPDAEESASIPLIKTFFKAYVSDQKVREIIESLHLTDLATNPVFSLHDYKSVPEKYRRLVPDYIKDYVSLNKFIA
jgi:type I restriction enzyme, R subunit